ncbi:MAG TPA: PilZ domain-containing protein [Xanthobacteraceae bacterium]|nr:PilZ domain-containing protein [Xanthobacteraceae bacterium]
MRADKRKARRRRFDWPSVAVIASGVPQVCRFADISASGARLMVKDSSGFPDRFTLILSVRGKVVRHCDVVWRKDKQIGVRFRPN